MALHPKVNWPETPILEDPTRILDKHLLWTAHKVPIGYVVNCSVILGGAILTRSQTISNTSLLKETVAGFTMITAIRLLRHQVRDDGLRALLDGVWDDD